MRYYTFRRTCGHTVRGSNKAKSLASKCHDCFLLKLESKLKRVEELPSGFGLWPQFLQDQWLRQNA